MRNWVGVCISIVEKEFGSKWRNRGRVVRVKLKKRAAIFDERLNYMKVGGLEAKKRRAFVMRSGLGKNKEVCFCSEREQSGG